MTNEADGESAFEALNNTELFERKLIVQWALKQRLIRVGRFHAEPWAVSS
jgi:RNA recognition motif-containing protein